MADTTQQMAAAEEKKEDAVPQQAKAHRMLQVSILRYNPADPDSVPHLQTYSVSETDSMTLYILLNELRDTQDPSLQFDLVCRAGICGSCAMLVNGKPTLACRCLTRDLPDHFTLAPLPGFELIGDLSVNTGKWMRGMSERIQSWCHLNDDNVNLSKIETPMDPHLAEEIYLLDRCVECGCCVASCGNFRMRPDSSVLSLSTRSLVSVWIRAITVMMPTTTKSSVLKAEFSAVCPFWLATTSARKICL